MNWNSYSGGRIIWQETLHRQESMAESKVASIRKAAGVEFPAILFCHHYRNSSSYSEKNKHFDYKKSYISKCLFFSLYELEFL
jgi:hypothetical protein